MGQRQQQVEHTHVVPVVDERVDDVGADESGAAGDEDPHAPEPMRPHIDPQAATSAVCFPICNDLPVGSGGWWT